MTLVKFEVEADIMPPISNPVSSCLSQAVVMCNISGLGAKYLFLV